MKSHTETVDSRQVIESQTFPELQERLISLINQEIELWKQKHPDFSAELIVHSKFSILYEKKTRFKDRRKLVLRITKNDGLFLPGRHLKICSQLRNSIDTSVASQYFWESQNPQYIIPGARQKTGITFDLIPKKHIELSEQRAERTTSPLNLKIEGFDSYEDVQKLMLSNMRKNIKAWNRFDHGLSAKIIVPEKFSFDPDNQSANPDDNAIRLRITRTTGPIKIMSKMLDYHWVTHLVASIEVGGTLMFMHRDNDEIMIKNKMKLLKGVEFKFRPNGYINFNNQK